MKAKKSRLPFKLNAKVLSQIKHIAKEGLLNHKPSKVNLNKQVHKTELPVIGYNDELNSFQSALNKIRLDENDERNPFQPALNKIRLDENENAKLNEFLEKAMLAKNVDELSKIVDKALNVGIRINAGNENGFTFSNVTIFKICIGKFEGNKQENIIRKLALSGADFNTQVDKKTIETCNKVQKEVELKVHDRLQKLKEIGESATTEGAVGGVEIDNKTFYMEFSQNSSVNVAKVVEGAKSLGLSRGELKLGGNVIKIGNGEVEIKTGENGERNYSDISDSSSFTIKFPTDLGELHVRIYQDIQNYDQVKVEVENKELWNELQKTEEIVGKGCLFGGISVKTAIERGSFIRSGRWGHPQSTEIIECAKPQSSETITWVDKIKSDKTSSVERS